MICIWLICRGMDMEVPAAVRAHWEKLLGQYLQTRRQLIGLVLIMDYARHPLKELDQRMLDWFATTEGLFIWC